MMLLLLILIRLWSLLLPEVVAAISHTARLIFFVRGHNNPLAYNWLDHGTLSDWRGLLLLIHVASSQSVAMRILIWSIALKNRFQTLDKPAVDRLVVRQLNLAHWHLAWRYFWCICRFRRFWLVAHRCFVTHQSQLIHFSRVTTESVESLWQKLCSLDQRKCIGLLGALNLRRWLLRNRRIHDQLWLHRCRCRRPRSANSLMKLQNARRRRAHSLLGAPTNITRARQIRHRMMLSPTRDACRLLLLLLLL